MESVNFLPWSIDVNCEDKTIGGRGSSKMREKHTVRVALECDGVRVFLEKVWSKEEASWHSCPSQPGL
jgi:hypothetical protein